MFCENSLSHNIISIGSSGYIECPDFEAECNVVGTNIGPADAGLIKKFE